MNIICGHGEEICLGDTDKLHCIVRVQYKLTKEQGIKMNSNA